MTRISDNIRFDEVHSDTSTVFFNIECPTLDKHEVEVWISLFTDGSLKASLNLQVYHDEELIFSNMFDFEEWEDGIELAHSVLDEYLFVSFFGPKADYVLQIKVQEFDPAVIFDIVKNMGAENEELIELGYITEGDCYFTADD